MSGWASASSHVPRRGCSCCHREGGASGAEDGGAAAASGAASQPSSELPLLKVEEAAEVMEDDALMSDVAALARTGQSADPVANLESALRPVERYAVRFLEEVRTLLLSRTPIPFTCLCVVVLQYTAD